MNGNSSVAQVFEVSLPPDQKNLGLQLFPHKLSISRREVVGCCQVKASDIRAEIKPLDILIGINGKSLIFPQKADENAQASFDSAIAVIAASPPPRKLRLFRFNRGSAHGDGYTSEMLSGEEASILMQDFIESERPVAGITETKRGNASPPKQSPTKYSTQEVSPPKPFPTMSKAQEASAPKPFPTMPTAPSQSVVVTEAPRFSPVYEPEPETKAEVEPSSPKMSKEEYIRMLSAQSMSPQEIARKREEVRLAREREEQRKKEEYVQMLTAGKSNKFQSPRDLKSIKGQMRNGHSSGGGNSVSGSPVPRKLDLDEIPAASTTPRTKAFTMAQARDVLNRTSNHPSTHSNASDPIPAQTLDEDRLAVLARIEQERAAEEKRLKEEKLAEKRANEEAAARVWEKKLADMAAAKARKEAEEAVPRSVATTQGPVGAGVGVGGAATAAAAVLPSVPAVPPPTLSYPAVNRVINEEFRSPSPSLSSSPSKGLPAPRPKSTVTVPGEPGYSSSAVEYSVPVPPPRSDRIPAAASAAPSTPSTSSSSSAPYYPPNYQPVSQSVSQSVPGYNANPPRGEFQSPAMARSLSQSQQNTSGVMPPTPPPGNGYHYIYGNGNSNKGVNATDQFAGYGQGYGQVPERGFGRPPPPDQQQQQRGQPPPGCAPSCILS